MAVVTGVGLGLRWDFLDDLAFRIESGAAPDLPFFEITPENHMRREGFLLKTIDRVAARYPFISHGLALSLGGTDPFDPSFLRDLALFLARYDSPFHSDHLCFSGADDRAIPDLLPLPHHLAAARHAAARVREAQERLGRPMAIENISYYVSPGAPEMTESEFLRTVLEEADCGLLLDVNNVHVNSLNFGFDAWEFIASLPLERVVEIHVAGHVRNEDRGLFIDTHGADIIAPVHDLLRRTIARTGPVPVVLERDNNVPDLDSLLSEVEEVRRHYELGLREREAGAREPSISANLRAGSRGRTPPPRGDAAPTLHAPELRDGAPGRTPEVSPARPETDTSHAAGLERLRSVQRVVQRLATMGEPPDDRPGAFLAWGAHPDDAKALSMYPKERLGVYGGLVAGTVLSAAKNQLAMTCARLPEALLRSLVQRFLVEDPPRSPYLRDVPFELAMWASELWRAAAGRASAPLAPDLDVVPAYLSDLARYELLLFACGTAPRGPTPDHPEPLSPARGVWLDGSVHVARFAHAVHLLPEIEGDLTEPEAADTALLCYRDRDDEVRKLTLTAPAMEILRRLYAGAPLARAIEEAASALARPVDAAFIEGISTVLADLSERGALLGPAPEGALPDRREASPYAEWLTTGARG